MVQQSLNESYVDKRYKDESHNWGSLEPENAKTLLMGKELYEKNLAKKGPWTCLAQKTRIGYRLAYFNDLFLAELAPSHSFLSIYLFWS